MSLSHMTWASLWCTVSKLHWRRLVSGVCRFGQIKSLWRLFWLTFNKRFLWFPNWHFHPQQSPIQRLRPHASIHSFPFGSKNRNSQQEANAVSCVWLNSSSIFSKLMPRAVCLHGQLMKWPGGSGWTTCSFEHSSLVDKKGLPHLKTCRQKTEPSGNDHGPPPKAIVKEELRLGCHCIFL